jgi:putative transposase
MLLLLKLFVWAVRASALSRRALVLDNLALRHQLATLAHCGRRPRLGPPARLFWVALRAVWSDWTKPLAIVKPATVVAWHLCLAKIPSVSRGFAPLVAVVQAADTRQ